MRNLFSIRNVNKLKFFLGTKKDPCKGDAPIEISIKKEKLKEIKK